MQAITYTIILPLYCAMFSSNGTQGSWTEWVQKAPDETKLLGVKGEDL